MALTFLAAQALAAPIMPSSAVVDQIQAVLDLRKSAGLKAEKLRKDTGDLEKEIGLRDKDGRLQPIDSAGVTEYAKRLTGLNDAKYEKYVLEIQQYKLAQQEYRSLSEQAIRMATAAYKPAPAINSGDIASGPPMPATEDDVPSFIGNRVAYAPVFSERVPQGRSGSTDDSGKVLIGPDAFSSPGKLAFTLYHEGEHFERLLTPGLDLRNSPAEEVLTRTRQRPLLKSTFGLTDKEIERFDQVLESDRIRAKKWDAALAQGLDPYKKSQQMAFPGNYKPLWLEDGVSQEVVNILARTKELRELERVEKEERAAFASQRRHDLQLRNKYLDLAQRSCEIPGSVTQEELDRLSLPYDEGFMAELPTDDCLRAVYKSLLKHESAEYIELVSRPRVIPLPTDRQDPPPPADVTAGKTFESILPRLREFAGLACKYQGNVPLPKELFTPRVPYFFTPREEASFSSLTGGLGKCESRVFRQLFEVLRDQHGDQINDRWLSQAVADPPPPTVIIPPAGGGGDGGGNSSRPPTGCIPGDRSRRNCIACGNRYCP